MDRNENYVLLEDIRNTVDEISTLIKTHHCPNMASMSTMIMNFGKYERGLSYKILSSRERPTSVQPEEFFENWPKVDMWENVK